MRPSFYSAMESMMNQPCSEKRAATRYPVVWLVELENGEGWTRDVSATGACIETDQPLACGVSIRFFMNKPEPQGRDTRVQCSGSVVWVEQAREGWRVGVMMEGVRFEG